MSFALTLFKARLVQESALTVSGIDIESVSDQPFARVDGEPVLSGAGLKGAAVAMARRCFVSLPASVTGTKGAREATTRSAWELDHARLIAGPRPDYAHRAGVGIRQATGARAEHVLYDREVMPAGTIWELTMRVDWRRARKAQDSPEEVEGILGYVLAEHWAKGRCWLGGGVARGLGWCRLDEASLAVYRLDDATREAWMTSGGVALPERERTCPTQRPTRAWYFRTRDVTLHAGPHQPPSSDGAWGVDMLAVGPHGRDASVQRRGEGRWVTPQASILDEGTALVLEKGAATRELSTNRAIVMERDIPLLLGSSLRGPLRHAFSRHRQRRGERILDPHTAEGDVPLTDAAAALFGTAGQSSRILIRDGYAAPEWAAARLQLHAEDEFSAGSYGTAKRDEVRLVRAAFSLRILVEGSIEEEVDRLQRELDALVRLGELGHLPIGGSKTRGAGWGRWSASEWRATDVTAEAQEPARSSQRDEEEKEAPPELPRSEEALRRPNRKAALRITCTTPDVDGELDLGAATALARVALGDKLSCWWCEPRIDFGRNHPPATFGWEWPTDERLQLDEVVFFTERASWRAARTARGWRAVLIEVCEGDAAVDEAGLVKANGREIPARLHQAISRFAADLTAGGGLTLCEWTEGADIVGYTAKREATRQGLQNGGAR